MGVVIDKAREAYEDDLFKDCDDPIVAVLNNCTCVLTLENGEARFNATLDKPLEINAKLEM